MPTAGTMPVRPTERRPSHRNRCRIRQGSGKPHPSVSAVCSAPRLTPCVGSVGTSNPGRCRLRRRFRNGMWRVATVPYGWGPLPRVVRSYGSVVYSYSTPYSTLEPRTVPSSRARCKIKVSRSQRLHVGKTTLGKSNG